MPTPYENTVLSQPYQAAPSTWDMFLFPGTVPLTDQIEVYEVDAGGAIITPAGTYTLALDTNPENFILTWVVPPVGAVTVYIFRRVQGAYEPFFPGAFLSAEALNHRFNLLTAARFDLLYYQDKTIPRYSVSALNEHGIPAYPPMSKGMPLPDLELPALHGETLNNVWTWGKTITNSPNPGDGYFSPYLISSGTYPTTPIFESALALQCPPATAGAHLIGVCSFLGFSMTAQEWITDIIPRDFDAASSGAQNIYAYVGNVKTSVQDSLDDFPPVVASHTADIAAHVIDIAANASATAANLLLIPNNAADIANNVTTISNGTHLRTHFLPETATSPGNIQTVSFAGFPAPFNDRNNITKAVISAYDFAGVLISSIEVYIGHYALPIQILTNYSVPAYAVLNNETPTTWLVQASGVGGDMRLSFLFFANP